MYSWSEALVKKRMKISDEKEKKKTRKSINIIVFTSSPMMKQHCLQNEFLFRKNKNNLLNPIFCLKDRDNFRAEAYYLCRQFHRIYYYRS